MVLVALANYLAYGFQQLAFRLWGRDMVLAVVQLVVFWPDIIYTLIIILCPLCRFLHRCLAPLLARLSKAIRHRAVKEEQGTGEVKMAEVEMLA